MELISESGSTEPVLLGRPRPFSLTGDEGDTLRSKSPGLAWRSDTAGSEQRQSNVILKVNVQPTGKFGPVSAELEQREVFS